MTDEPREKSEGEEWGRGMSSIATGGDEDHSGRMVLKRRLENSLAW